MKQYYVRKFTFATVELETQNVRACFFIIGATSKDDLFNQSSAISSPVVYFSLSKLLFRVQR